jgi:hypothetical protein
MDFPFTETTLLESRKKSPPMNFGLVARLPAQWPLATATAARKVAPVMLASTIGRTETPTMEAAAMCPRLAPATSFGAVASGQARPPAQAVETASTAQLAVEGQATVRHESELRGLATSMIVEIADDEATNFTGGFLVDDYNEEDCNN